MSMQEKNAANQQMDEMAKQINILAENYPELKSSNNFAELQRAIADVEEHLQAARRLYNANVSAYNAKIVVFPNSIVANGMGAREKVYFEAEEYKRQDVKMSF
jgi:LemA protein